MPDPIFTVNILVGDIEVRSEWNDTETSRRIRETLPLEVAGKYWGGSLRFQVPVEINEAADALDVAPPGTIAYWPPSRSLYLFWGPTPASRGNESRAPSRVNVVGLVTNPEVLPRLRALDVRVSIAKP